MRGCMTSFFVAYLKADNYAPPAVPGKAERRTHSVWSKLLPKYYIARQERPTFNNL